MTTAEVVTLASSNEIDDLRNTGCRNNRFARASILHPHIALLSPYNGGNLGDAAIHDALIANLRQRIPGVRFSGISLNCDNFVERHGKEAFPICGIDQSCYWMLQGRVRDQNGAKAAPVRRGWKSLLKSVLTGMPPLWRALKGIQVAILEVRHWILGYRFLRTKNLLIVCGGGQLNDEGGGPWCHPFALFKWAVLARFAGIPFAIASVGAGQASSRTSRFLLSAALRMAVHRTYRDLYSRNFAAGLLKLASDDAVVPDLALSIPPKEMPRPVSYRAKAQGRIMVALSPICYAKPGTWPTLFQNRGLYERYLKEMATLVAELLGRDCYLVIVWSSLWDDESAIADLMERLDDQSRSLLERQMHVATISGWRDLVAVLEDIDVLIASRLHSVILGFMSRKPAIAISFDPKVDRVMQDFGQLKYLFQFRSFTSADVIESLETVRTTTRAIKREIDAYLEIITPASARQYDALAELATAQQS